MSSDDSTRSSTRIWLALILAAVGWGTGSVASRAALIQGLGPYALAALTATAAAIIALPFAIIYSRRLPHGRELWRVVGVMGAVHFAAPFVLVTLALQHASAGYVALLMALTPLVTAVWGHILLPDEPLNISSIGGLVVALIGVTALLTSNDSGLASGGRPGLATFFALAGVVTFAFGAVFARLNTGSYEPIQLAGLQIGVGAVILVVCMLVFEGAPSGVTGTNWALIGYLAAADNIAPFALFYWIVSKASVRKASLVGYLTPLIAAITGVLLLGEELQSGIITGGFLIMLGVILVNHQDRETQKG